jgi:hypothetical protein
MRPNLKKGMSASDFKNFYWLKEELQLFCRENGLSASGTKIEIAERIECFLLTGEIKKPVSKSVPKQQQTQTVPLSLETVITGNHRCSQEVRAFFKEVIGPKFHFSTYIQQYFKMNVGKTYRDVVKAWYEEEERKIDPSYKKEIARQFEYNQFFRDYFADPDNKGKSREEAIQAWNQIKKLPGSNKYTKL